MCLRKNFNCLLWINKKICKIAFSSTYKIFNIEVYFFLYYRSICIIDNGASRRRTRNAIFRARRAKLICQETCLFYKQAY